MGGGDSREAAQPGPPAGLFWPAALLLDLILLVLLPRAPWVLVGGVAAIVVLLLLRHGAAALAFAIAGLPLLQPIADWTGDSRPGFYIVNGLLLGAVLVRFWQGIWDPRRMESVLSLPRRAVWLFGAGLGVLMLLSLTWTPTPHYGGGKTQLYWTTNMVLVTAAIILLSRSRGRTSQAGSARLLFGTLLGLEILLAAGAVWNWFTGYYPYRDRLVAWGLNPIWLARHAGLGLLVALVLVEMRAMRRRWLGLLLPLFAWVFAQTVSRGPTFALAAALAFWFLAAPITPVVRRRRAFGLGMAGLGLGALFLIELAGSEHAAGQQMSNQVRLWLLQGVREGLSGISLLGVGAGGFSALLGVPDRRWYPHNLIAEVVLENGLLGLTLLGGLVVAAGAAWRRWGRFLSGVAASAIDGARSAALDRSAEEPVRRGAGALFLFAILCAQFSGDIWVNEWVWAFAGVLAAWAPRGGG